MSHASVNDDQLRLALPSKGELSEPTLRFLSSAGMTVLRPNQRQYVATVPAVPGMTVLFQRAADIFGKVSEGSADLGVTGYDIVREQGVGRDHVLLLQEDLGYGRCELVLAVPDTWIDVTSIDDLGDLASHYKEQGHELRIATKYPNATKDWLYARGIVHFTLVEAEGALEAAPSMGYADLIADLTTTGTTLRENHLKRLAGGTILSSQACLIGNGPALRDDPAKLALVRGMLERLEARLTAKRYLSITANVQGESDSAIAARLLAKPTLAGMRGPTLARVHTPASGDGEWYAATIVVERRHLLDAIDHLREVGGCDITVAAPEYVFGADSRLFREVEAKLARL